MSVQIDFQERPSQEKPSQGGGPDKWTPACDTPHPPHWCPDAPDANIDMGIGLLIVVGLIIGIITIYLKRMDNN